MKATPPLRPSRRDLPAATPGRLFGGLIVLVGLTLLLPVRWSVAQDAREVSRPVIFAQPLEWCGDQRLAAAQAPALQEVMDLQGPWGIEGLVEGLEQFLEALPDSPWAPSLRINLGRFYFEQGRYTPALMHWQAAWEATRQTPTDPERRIADYAFAHWTRVLAGLGRVEMVQLLYAENADREFTPGPIETMVARTGEALALVLSQPDTLHQCGLLALGEVARGVGADPAVVQALREIRAPAWSLRHLLDAAEPFELELLAVELPEGTDWVVPSVVHLRQNHYVAIIARDGEVYEVADPSFGRNQFLSGAALWSEASGVCLVPARLIEGPWRLLADAELDGIVGRGYVTSFDA